MIDLFYRRLQCKLVNYDRIFYLDYAMVKQTNWREDPGLTSYIKYKRKFAFWPKNSADNKIWFKHYYSVHRIWTHSYDKLCVEYLHDDFVENITEAEYIVRKLSGKL